jgi:hypothetical protein
MNVRRWITLGTVLLGMLANPPATPVQAQDRQVKQIGNGTPMTTAWNPDGSRLNQETRELLELTGTRSTAIFPLTG